MVRESHSFPGKPVEMGRFDLLLPVATKLGVAEVVGKDEDNIGYTTCLRFFPVFFGTY